MHNLTLEAFFRVAYFRFLVNFASLFLSSALETGMRFNIRITTKSFIRMKKIVFIATLLMASITLVARQKPADEEQQQPHAQEQAMVAGLLYAKQYLAQRSLHLCLYKQDGM